MMAYNVLRCPYCGFSADILPKTKNELEGQTWQACCLAPRCDAQGPHFLTVEAARKAWNKVARLKKWPRESNAKRVARQQREENAYDV